MTVVSPPFAIGFDEPPHLDEVIFALEPLDAFDGRLVTGPLRTHIDGLPDRPRRNLRGLLVFLNLPARPTYDVIIEAAAAGYFDARLTVPRPASDARSPDRRKPIALFRRPTFQFEAETTLVRGSVVRDGTLVRDVEVEAKAVPARAGVPGFATITDQRGVFALPLRLPKSAVDASGPPRARFEFLFRDSGSEHRLERLVEDGRAYVFGLPIDLGQDDPAAVPVLVPIRP
jgi:hypothetical protein